LVWVEAEVTMKQQIVLLKDLVLKEVIHLYREQVFLLLLMEEVVVVLMMEIPLEQLVRVEVVEVMVLEEWQAQ
jgi:hypothetical protein